MYVHPQVYVGFEFQLYSYNLYPCSMSTLPSIQFHVKGHIDLGCLIQIQVVTVLATYRRLHWFNKTEAYRVRPKTWGKRREKSYQMYVSVKLEESSLQDGCVQ